MKVIFDANVLLSFILAPDPNQTVARVVQTCFFTPGIVVLAPAELIEETTDKALTKRYFRNKISRATIEDFLALLVTHSEVLPPWHGQMEQYGSDRKDDYLVAYGLLHRVDYLVTGDRHLLALRQIEELMIVQPITMLAILEQYTGWNSRLQG